MTRLPGAQAVIQIVLRRTNLLMAGKRVAILGEVPGLAARLRAMGAHPGADLAGADLVIAETPPDLSTLKPGAVVATCGSRGVRVREGVGAVEVAPGHEVFVLDLTC
ncbi:hypothetical protein [Nonomuraea sp. NPDC046570]|uniref:hypothetical protein n=1 Tax=Nonomuraea sp. NPDC046570 TaxID=3155255 RepID=UPI0033F97FDF